MRSTRSAVLALVLLFALASAAYAGEPRPEIWTYAKDGQTRTLDVTHMSPAVRAAIAGQLKERGWTRVEAPAPAKGEGLSPGTLRDIEELVRRGGKLPPGYVPHGAGEGGTSEGADAKAAPPPAPQLDRAAGLLILRYLEVKDDPARAPAYETVLREVAKALAAPATPLRRSRLLRAVIERVLKGLDDPEQGAAYLEVARFLLGALLPPEAPRPPPLPPAAPKAGPVYVGGAQVVRRLGAGGAASWHVLGVEPGSQAQRMGLQAGDRIRRVNGRPADAAALSAASALASRGGKLELVVARKDGKIAELEFAFEGGGAAPPGAARR